MDLHGARSHVVALLIECPYEPDPADCCLHGMRKKSIEENIGTSVFKRIRMGISNENLVKIKSQKSRNKVVNFVLSKFSSEERKMLSKFCELGVQSTLTFLKKSEPKTYKLTI